VRTADNAISPAASRTTSAGSDTASSAVALPASPRRLDGRLG
jgi:hypothetical protein